MHTQAWARACGRPPALFARQFPCMHGAPPPLHACMHIRPSVRRTSHWTCMLSKITQEYSFLSLHEAYAAGHTSSTTSHVLSLIPCMQAWLAAWLHRLVIAALHGQPLWSSVLLHACCPSTKHLVLSWRAVLWLRCAIVRCPLDAEACCAATCPCR